MIERSYYKGGYKNNRKTFKILNEHEVLPNTIQPQEKNVGIVFKFEGDPTDIVFVKPGCSCTAGVEIIGNTIIAKFTESDIAANGSNVSEQQKRVGTVSFTKNLTVYLDDGLPLKVQSGLGKVLNGNKTNIPIKFTVKVDVSKFRK